MTCERSNTTCHYVNNRVRNMILSNMLATSFQSSYIIINCLRWTNLRNINFKTMSIMKFEFMRIKFSYTFKFAFVHISITIGLTRNVILNIFIILMIFCKFIYKRFITAIGTKTFCAYQINMLYVFL